VENCRPDHLGAMLDRMWEAGLPFDCGSDWIQTFAHDTRARPPRPTDVTTHAYPGFPTDLQAQMMSYLTLAEGISTVTEKVFPERFIHVGELNRLGASITLDGAKAIIRGVDKLTGAQTMASDLRASAAIVLAGLAAEGETEVSRIYHLDRGYEKFEEKLRALGARIKRERTTQ